MGTQITKDRFRHKVMLIREGVSILQAQGLDSWSNLPLQWIAAIIRHQIAIIPEVGVCIPLSIGLWNPLRLLPFQSTRQWIPSARFQEIMVSLPDGVNWTKTVIMIIETGKKISYVPFFSEKAKDRNAVFSPFGVLPGFKFWLWIISECFISHFVWKCFLYVFTIFFNIQPHNSSGLHSVLWICFCTCLHNVETKI